MRISIILATFNGEKFIKKQLKSIKEQSLIPDEVLIFDDCSVDNTTDIIEKFISDNFLRNWKLHINEENLGYTKNFLTGVLETKGDVIFLCDQDDIWQKNKLKEMSIVMEGNTNIVSLCSQFETINEEDTIIRWKNRLINTKKNSKIQIKKLDFQSYAIVGRILGCTMCFRKNVIKHINIDNKVISSISSHDSYINIIASALGDICVLNKVLTRYRIHSDNTSIKNTKGQSKEGRISHIKNRILYCENYVETLERVDRENTSDYVKFLSRFIIFEKNRIAMINSSKFGSSRTSSCLARSVR